VYSNVQKYNLNANRIVVWPNELGCCGSLCKIGKTKINNTKLKRIFHPFQKYKIRFYLNFLAKVMGG